MHQRIAALMAVAVAVGVGAVHAASAADIPAKAPAYKSPAAVVAYNWSGFYVGANAGAAWQRSCWTFLTGSVDEGCHDDTAVTAGGQLGVNWQTGNWVFGLEASGNWANLKASSVSTGFPTFTNETRTDAIGLFTGRVGWAWSNALAYVKGGAALTNNEYRAFVTATPSAFSHVGDVRWGWTVGGGLEYGFAPNWSAAVEYDYVDTGAKDEGIPGDNVFDRITQRIHMVTLRVNYRFAPWLWR